jgi:hypothetical protein
MKGGDKTNIFFVGRLRCDERIILFTGIVDIK